MPHLPFEIFSHWEGGGGVPLLKISSLAPADRVGRAKLWLLKRSVTVRATGWVGFTQMGEDAPRVS